MAKVAVPFCAAAESDNTISEVESKVLHVIRVILQLDM
jgi:hypothetical protein